MKTTQFEQGPSGMTVARDVVGRSEDLGEWWMRLWEIAPELAMRGATIPVLSDGEFRARGGDPMLRTAFGEPDGRWIWFGEASPALGAFLRAWIPAMFRCSLLHHPELGARVRIALEAAVWDGDTDALHRVEDALWLARHGLSSHAIVAISRT